MVVGVLTVELFLAEVSSLKGKRRILRGLIDRLKGKFNIAVAEVGKQDSWRQATLGVSTVSNESAHVYKVLSAVINFIETYGDVELMDYKTELL